MRAFVTKGGFPTFVSIRESKFINEHFCEKDLLEKQGLSEREAHIAQTLVSRGVLDKVINAEGVSYKLNINNYSR
jgi:hypothetical protein